MTPKEHPDPILSGKICPYCGQASELIDSKEVYGRSYGPIYICWPCNAYCGTHKGTTISLGRLANYHLREMKKQTHAAFDPIWKGGQLRRSKAYQRLSKLLGIPPGETHIGMFSPEQCQQAIQLCKNLDLWN